MVRQNTVYIPWQGINSTYEDDDFMLLLQNHKSRFVFWLTTNTFSAVYSKGELEKSNPSILTAFLSPPSKELHQL